MEVLTSEPPPRVKEWIPGEVSRRTLRSVVPSTEEVLIHQVPGVQKVLDRSLLFEVVKVL